MEGSHAQPPRELVDLALNGEAELVAIERQLDDLEQQVLEKTSERLGRQADASVQTERQVYTADEMIRLLSNMAPAEHVKWPWFAFPACFAGEQCYL